MKGKEKIPMIYSHVKTYIFCSNISIRINIINSNLFIVIIKAVIL